MKIRITFKNPDAIDDAIDETVDWLQLPVEEEHEIKEKIKTQLSKWISYGEYVNLEFDLDNETAIVLQDN